MRVFRSQVMIRRTQACAASVFLYAFALAVAAQSVYPTGTTIYDPGRAWNGYTVLSPLRTQAVIVIDMNGNVVKQWDGYVNAGGGPRAYFPRWHCHGRQRNASAASGITRASPARLRRQSHMAV